MTIRKISVFTAMIMTFSFFNVSAVAAEENPFQLSRAEFQHLSFNSVRGKPPFNRARKNKLRRINQQSIELSALEIDESGVSKKTHVRGTRKNFRYGHPDFSKKR